MSDSERSANGFSQLGEEGRFEGWAIRVVEGTYMGPDGSVFKRDVVRHPGAVAVVPVTDHKTALLVRQYRAPLDRFILEIPAGTRDVHGEPSEVTAHRELAEEVGMRATTLRPLGRIYNTPGFCDEVTDLYMATGLTPCATARSGIEELHMQVVEVPLDAPREWLSGPDPVDAQSVLGLMLVIQTLNEQDSIPHEGG